MISALVACCVLPGAGAIDNTAGFGTPVIIAPDDDWRDQLNVDEAIHLVAINGGLARPASQVPFLPPGQSTVLIVAGSSSESEPRWVVVDVPAEAGLVERSSTQRLVIDQTPPVVTRGTGTSPAKITDPSGIATVVYLLDGQPLSERPTRSEVGNGKLTVVATDLAGNRSTSGLDFSPDEIAPKIHLRLDAGTVDGDRLILVSRNDHVWIDATDNGEVQAVEVRQGDADWVKPERPHPISARAGVLEIRATDEAGNVSLIAWEVDRD